MALNEFRKDLSSGEWILFATGRAQGHLSGSKEEFYQPKADCPFETLSEQEIVALYKNGTKVSTAEASAPAWDVAIIKNKYPALNYGVCAEPRTNGFFTVADAYGFHELVITRDHDIALAHLSPEMMVGVLKVYRDRMKEMMADKCGRYILIFHNFGSSAGATVFHNHSQIISFPFVPPEVERAMENAISFHADNGHRLTETILEWEEKNGQRVFAKNERCLAVCPYASRLPYEVRIFPNEHKARFELSDDRDLECLAELLSGTLKAIEKIFHRVDYNFYIHSAPAPNTYDNFYRWHIEIVPRLSMVGALELGTYVFTNVADPDEAARNIKEAWPK